jgi:putative radical SAM-modified peptide
MYTIYSAKASPQIDGQKTRGGYVMEIEVLAEGVEDAEMVSACCTSASSRS